MADQQECSATLQTRTASAPSGHLDRHRLVMEQGRTLVKSSEARVAMQGPFLFAAQSTGRALDLGIRRLTTFALVLSAIVIALLLSGAAPAPLGLIVALWLTGAVILRMIAAKRRQQHGLTLIDFEARRVEARTLAGDLLAFPLTSTRAFTERSADEQAPVWIMLASEGKLLRLARASEADAERVLAIFRGQHMRVEPRHRND